jgi:photosystem II stability/assembly factor-like uncharacterized protein
LYDLIPPRGVKPARIVTIEPNERGVMLVATSGDHLYGSFDVGKTWSSLTGDRWTLFGRYPSVVVAPSDPTVMYRYDPNGTIKKSTDGGATWAETHPRLDGRSAKDVAFAVGGKPYYVLEIEIAAVHPRRALTVYGTMRIASRQRVGEPYREQYFLRGMYVSEDGGENWTRFSDQIGRFTPIPRSISLGISPSNPQVMFSEGEHGILRTVDGGRSWRPVGESDLLNLVPLDVEDRSEGILISTREAPLNVQEFAFDPASSSIVYLRTRKGIYRSEDEGDGWLLLNLGFDRLNAVNSFAVDPQAPTRVIAGTDRGLFVSEDRGCHFSRIRMPETDR